MKRKITTLFLCFAVIFISKTVAQSLPDVSENVDVWYYIKSGSSNSKFANKYITDVTGSEPGTVKFALQAKNEGDRLQQWKLIKPVNATSNNVHFVNRVTQNIIQTRFDFNGYYVAQSTTNAEESNGWKLEIISGSQIKISGLDETGIIGYLNVASDQQAFQDIPTQASAFANSVYAWVFEAVGEESSIREVNLFPEVKIYVENRKIMVENAGEYEVFHISGIKTTKNEELPVGVYLVKIQGKTKSVLVK